LHPFLVAVGDPVAGASEDRQPNGHAAAAVMIVSRVTGQVDQKP